MRPLVFFLSLFLTMPLIARAEDFNIEDSSLIALPKPIEVVIQHAEGKNLIDDRNPKNGQCKLIGKPVDLGLGDKSGYVATTANGCIWGASSGPIWAVLTKPRPSLVLAYGGVSLTLQNQASNGLKKYLFQMGLLAGHQKPIGNLMGQNILRSRKTFTPIRLRSSEDISTSEWLMSQKGNTVDVKVIILKQQDHNQINSAQMI